MPLKFKLDKIFGDGGKNDGGKNLSKYKLSWKDESCKQEQ